MILLLVSLVMLSLVVVAEQVGVNSNISCTDSDGGRNYFVKGSTVERGDAIALDNCQNGSLIETYCDNGLAKFEILRCPSGYSCSNGACVGNNSVGPDVDTGRYRNGSLIIGDLPVYCEDYPNVLLCTCKEGIKTPSCTPSEGRVCSAVVSYKCVEREENDNETDVNDDNESGVRMMRNKTERKEMRENDSDRTKRLREGKGELRRYFNNQSECPDKCTCAGSTVKCEFENGSRTMTVYAGKSGNIIIQIKGVNVTTTVELYKNENGSVEGVFRNKTKVVMLPDEAVKRLQEKLNKKVEEGKIELNEDGEYVMKARGKGRLFGLIPVQKTWTISVNAETGEVISTKTGFWGKLTADSG